MKVNYVLMYGTPYLKYREFETFEDVSKFLVNKSIVNYSIFKKLEDKEEVEMIYRDNDINYLKAIIKEVRQDLLNTKRLNKHIKDKYNNEYLNMDIEHIDYLIKILDKDNNNEY